MVFFFGTSRPKMGAHSEGLWRLVISSPPKKDYLDSNTNGIKWQFTYTSRPWQTPTSPPANTASAPLIYGVTSALSAVVFLIGITIFLTRISPF